MIGYITLGTNDLPRAIKFYDELLSVLNAKVVYETERNKAWSTGPGQAGLSICKPFDGKPASFGNGTMVALAVDSNAKVDAIYKKAIELGGKDEGAPGERMPGYYGAYFRDLDGNKLNAFFMERK
jgi:catechol 2,3-dioxygenase-like lactoylglutathione lyase family enzyme